ncbi:PREDICTED: zinc finger protein ZFAT isoform X3 [Pterocles gutturalis]|uniref:zinc finger protein ZFAT isoform X3 n=1 Tax=Pterocles gutturalis TaxID=240206 RepID=UPI0005283183|nr:PREDICTED: zinc finger protein ZFAT isoform X3 [Pterocles gutturalis]
MCKLCNLFSPNQSELLSHVSEKHTEEGTSVDDIIIPLQPLTVPTNINKDGEELLVVKRKRGRPKGSTKKFCVDEDVAENNPVPSEETPPGTEEGPELSEVSPGSLECRKCNRKFSNTRQLRKHICIIVLNEGEEEGDGGNDSDVDLDRKEDEREKTPKRPRVQKTEKTPSTKETEQVSGAKNPIISVVLTAHEAIPGATKIVPVEATPQESEPTTPEATVQDSSQRRGYQEYAIQQTPYEQAMKSSRLGPTQLKIFTCEYCNKVFKFKHSLQAHLRIHTNEKPYKCSYCSYASAIKANLNVHMRKHTGEKFSCDYCTFTCLSKGHLKVHIERVHKKIKQHCRFCKKKYSDVKNLIKHIKETHDLQDKKVKDVFDELRLMTREGKRQLLYDCHICERKFKNELDRDRHMLVHGDERPFACELCGHGATKYQALELHVRKHPFVYVCSVCLKKFVSSVRLHAHIKDVHADLHETSVFNSSINQSFCLLEPGGDIQPEALGEQVAQSTDELGDMNTNAIDTPQPSACKGDSTAADVNHNGQHNGDLKIDTVPLLEFENPPVENLTEKLCQPADIGVASIQSSVASDCFLQKDGTSGSDVLKVSPANEEEVNHCNSVNEQGEEINLLLSEDKSLNPSQNNAVTEDLSVSEERNQSVPSNESETSNPPIQDSTETTKPLAAPEADAAARPRAASSNAVTSDSGSGAVAFMQILDSLQKRQMNTELCERIRKVYGDLECEYCGKLFWYQVHYDMHVRTHTREHLYYCSQCNYSSITKNCLKRHVIQKHSNILLKCPTEHCDYSTPDKYKLQAHLKVHTELDKKSYSCPVCEKSFSEDRLIKSHIKTNHPEVSMTTISEILGRRVQLKGLIGKRAVKCPYCDFYFMKNGSDLQRHIWAHEGVKPFKCSLCEYATRSKSNLKAHMNRHSTEKTHLCDMCGKKFKSKGTLKSHKLLHTADGKQFKCTVCDYTAAQKPQLLRHMEQHVSFKPFRCAHCHYSCNISGSLKRHYNRKHPNEEYVNVGSGEPAAEALIQQGGIKCPVCSFVYGTKWEFNRHLKNKHGMKLVEQDGESKWEVKEEEQSANHTLMIQETLQQASVELSEQHHLVVSSDEVEGIETVTVYTQGGEASEFIVYVQEAMQPVEEQTVEQSVQEL